MQAIGYWIRFLARVLQQMPVAAAKAIKQALANIWALLLWLLGLLTLLCRRRWHDQEKYKKQKCIEIPPDVARRPDPCIYSQPYLAAKGMAVTWDNPDIQITLPSSVPVSSGELQADTDYLVQATIHNASFDAAIGVEVRCLYRPWSFDSPDRVPVEIDANGDPAVRIVHIPPWGQQLATFTWRTPHVAEGQEHFCIQVECFHAADREPNNNLGQENTKVQATASETRLMVPLFNRRQEAREFRISADEYRIPDGRIEVHLKPIRGFSHPKDEAAQALAQTFAELGGEFQRLAFDDERALRRLLEIESLRGARLRISPKGRRLDRGVGYQVFRYEGLKQVVEPNRRGAFPVSDGWKINLPGAERADDDWLLTVQPNQVRDVEVLIQPPANAEGKTINLTAVDRRGGLVGGVTVVFGRETQDG